ncbi:response regulator transcription factor [candidate division KSB1 bacterium]|nr:response regulator transcription factor [candidate division KSB1 bacterium]
MTRILVVEDEFEMAKGLQDNFEFEGYEVELAKNGTEALEKVASFTPHLIVLDVMLPHKSGYDVCREMRSKNNNTPIIMLTARGEEIDKILGLELGADDYITKPFSVRELLSRVKAVLRRTPDSDGRSPICQIGKLTLDFDQLTAHDVNGEVELSHKEFEILKYFVEHQGEIISRDQFLDKVWGYEHYPTSRTVDNYIVKLRKAIEENPVHPRHIITVYGIGYKFIR